MKYNQSADVIKIPQQDTRQRVFCADNTDSSWQNSLFGFGVFLIVSAIVGYSLGDTLGEQMLIGAKLYIPFAMLALLVVTGTLTTLVGIVIDARITNKQTAVSAAQVDATKAIALLELERDIQLNEQDYNLKKLTIEAQTEQRRLMAPGKQPSFVQAVPDEAREAVLDWLMNCYASTWPNEYTNNIDGNLHHNPWGREWKGQPWCDDAKRLAIATVLEPVSDTRPVRQWVLRYRLQKDATNAVEAERS